MQRYPVDVFSALYKDMNRNGEDRGYSELEFGRYLLQDTTRPFVARHNRTTELSMQRHIIGPRFFWP